MQAPLQWSSERDAAIKTMRASGATWSAIAATIHVSRSEVVERAHAIGAYTEAYRPLLWRKPPAARDATPLPAGHPVSWAVLVSGTLLAGTPYPA